MIAIALYQPEIPPNTGNVIRLCANIGAELHLIQPLGFELDDRRLRRAGLDYREYARIVQHPNVELFFDKVAPRRVIGFTTRARRHYHEVSFSSDDVLLFGPETRGLPDDLLAGLPERQRLRMPMRPCSRSLNLSNAVAVAAFEAWRQLGFKGGR